jgi:uncharacterized protein
VRRIVLDTNVIISALLFGGEPRSILGKVIEGELKLGLSRDILEETANVLSRKRFVLERDFISIISRELEDLAEMVFPGKKIDQVKQDPSDNRILECAEAFRADYLISGDKHLLQIKEYHGIKIVRPADFVVRYLE